MKKYFLVFLIALLVLAGCGNSAPKLKFGSRGLGGNIYTVKNTSLPSVSGTTTEGFTLTGNEGSWNHSVIPSYQWLRCNSGGSECVPINGATSPGYVLIHSDVGHTIRLKVIGLGSHEVLSGEGLSSTSSVIAAGENSETPNLTKAHCFENVETEGSTRIEECNYPGPNNVGQSKVTCEADPEFIVGEQGSVAFRSGIELKNETGKALTITGKRFKVKLGTKEYDEGSVVIGGPEIHFSKDCFVVENTSSTQQSPVLSTSYSGAVGVKVTESSIYTKNGPAKEFFFAGFENHGGASGVVFEKDRIEDCEECYNGGQGTELETISRSFLIANGGIENSGVHREVVYQEAGKLLMRGDTILNPTTNTATIFGNTNNGNMPYGACKQQTTIEETLMAGSSDGVELCGKEPEERPGTASFTFLHNRIARCTTTPIKERNAEFGEGSSYFFCSGSGAQGRDANGYYPKGGAQSIISTLLTAGQVSWEGNFYDDTPATPLSFATAKE